jgi:putative ABC transport system permease protein
MKSKSKKGVLMQSVIRSIRNILRNSGRLILVVSLLGVSLMFVASMVSLSTNSQQELATVHKQVGTTITINYATNDASSGQQGNPGGSGSNGPGFFGGPPKPIPNSVITHIKQTRGVASVQESLERPYTDGTLQGTMITAPTGQQMNAPIIITGISSDSPALTILQGITPTLVSGRGFRASDNHANVAMMSQPLAQANQLQVGSTFSVNGTTCTLIGMYTTGNQLADSSIILPIATMEKAFQVNGVDSVTATAASYEQVESVAARLRSVLGKSFDVVTQTAQYRNVFRALQVAQQSIQITLVVSFLIAAAVVIFAVLMLVRERTAEIAILKTIGASHWQVVRQFWLEILAMSASAAILAVFLLFLLGPFLAQKFDIDPSSLVSASSAPPGAIFTQTIGGGPGVTTASNPLSNVHLAAANLNAQTLLIIVGVGMGLALLTSLIPTWAVSHIKPAIVLRRA